MMGLNINESKISVSINDTSSPNKNQTVRLDIKQKPKLLYGIYKNIYSKYTNIDRLIFKGWETISYATLIQRKP